MHLCANILFFQCCDNDYVKEKYNGKKNNRLEDITDIEEDVVEDTVREEEIIPIIEKEN